MRISRPVVTALVVLVAPTVAAAQSQQREVSALPRAAAPAAPARPVAPARPAAPPGLQVPQAAGLVILIRGTVSALNQANLTGNYTVLHALGSDTLRANTNPQSLAHAFAAFRQRGADLSPALILNPQLSDQPTITGGRLHLVGRFPSQPYSVTFDIWYEISQNRWKPVQINAGLAQAQPRQGQAQPQGNQQRPAQPQSQQPRGAQPQQQAPRRQ